VADPVGTEGLWTWLVRMTDHRRRSVRFTARAILIVSLAFFLIVMFFIGSAQIEERRDAVGRLYGPFFQALPFDTFVNAASVLFRVLLVGGLAAIAAAIYTARQQKVRTIHHMELMATVSSTGTLETKVIRAPQNRWIDLADFARQAKELAAEYAARTAMKKVADLNTRRDTLDAQVREWLVDEDRARRAYDAIRVRRPYPGSGPPFPDLVEEQEQKAKFLDDLAADFRQSPR